MPERSRCILLPGIIAPAVVRYAPLIRELGTAAAVVIDASLVRALLVPALMRLLGRWNWWASRPLRRLHARLQLGEA